MDKTKEVRIEPTVGRVVWFRPAAHDILSKAADGQPLAGHVAHVNENGTLTLAVLSAEGGFEGRRNVPLIQGDDEKPEGLGYAEWMPYQKGQAAKAEQDGHTRKEFDDLLKIAIENDAARKAASTSQRESGVHDEPSKPNK